MNIKKYNAKVVEIKNIIPDVYTVSFYSEKKFKFKPGQFLHLALDEYNPSGAWPDSRAFSIQSPTMDNLIKITYSTVGKFTNRMTNELSVGRDVWLKMPYGNLFQGDFFKKNCVFIAGGTGITPFLSLFNNNEFKEYEKPKLYFGIKSIKYNLYEKELLSAKNNNPEFEINYYFEDTDGIIDIDKIFIKNRNATYFISGPPQMIKIFNNKLKKQGVDGEKIITDEWE